ncbi:TetR family transcriptional regulator [Actinomadura sp. HBU206391]|uniref:TetR family transcriptional regulator n=1 Tax=Actinomadura sp. HBU206391 TaxID=2731692 RepID=UPI00164F0155|nr:TetR family transcriptional regulator [Actinomadura sp. HBU206391]MBC6456530.1 TetR/AcrR family transcriptional regulator [Actinomadura sp. HBU206391]
MAGDAEVTKRRLLDAATAEFAAFGIAGARVDRIAAAAKSNKAQIYHYFGSKDALFDAVFNALVVQTVRETPIDPADLPGYAARLFDGFEDHPQVPRLATWYRLERAGTQEPLETIVSSNRDKVAAIATAQKEGRLPTRFAAEDLLALVLAIASMWTTLTPEFAALVSGHGRDHRRQIVIDAVTALLSGR